MAVTLVSCYFLPFLLFFAAQIAFPRSLASFVLGIAAASIGTLILFFQLRYWEELFKKKATPVVQSKPKVTQEESVHALAFAQKALTCTPKHVLPDTKALIAEQQQALISQKNLFTEELEKRALTLKNLQQALDNASALLISKEAEIQNQKLELDNLKFEMYTLLRIDSYMEAKGPPRSSQSEKLVTASF